MSNRKDILVYPHWEGIREPVLMGILSAIPARGREVFSFEYDAGWLQSGFTHVIDPDLQFYPGQFFPKEEQSNFGIFLDSCPDRWGRMLMDRKEAVMARRERRDVKKLHDSDYLLGVFDEFRMGGIRFKLEEDGPFLDDDDHVSIPPWASLRELERAVADFEEDNLRDHDYLKSITLLIAPGSSLGGARPKVSVTDPDNRLWIAKFPSLKDKKNVGAWELVTNRLAAKSGIAVCQSLAKQFGQNHHTFLTRRFDRNEKGERIHFASAMTMLGYKDGDGHDTGASYLEIAEFLIRHGANPNADLEELWRRIVFSICVRNTDDHLRNHGFLLSTTGWRLSPAYDLNPNEFGTGLSLNISESENSLDLGLALEVAEYFRIEKGKANKIIAKVKGAVSKWKEEAKGIGISRNEQDAMKHAFELAE